MSLDAYQLLQGRRAPRIVERIRDLFVATLDQLEYRQVPLMAGLLAAGNDIRDLGKRALAEALERDGVELTKDFPIGFTNVAQHRGLPYPLCPEFKTRVSLPPC